MKKRKAGIGDSCRRGRRGAVTFIQRCGDALNLNVHFHMLALDGVYAEDDNGRISFRPVAAPGDRSITSCHDTQPSRQRVPIPFMMGIRIECYCCTHGRCN